MAKILVVDDEERITALCETILKRAGHEVRTANNSVQFMHCIQKQKFDVMITDLKMPEMDGFLCCEKALKLQPNIGIIIMTGLMAMGSKEEETARNFAHRLIRKPFNIQDLEEAVKSFLDKKL